MNITIELENTVYFSFEGFILKKNIKTFQYLTYLIRFNDIFIFKCSILLFFRVNTKIINKRLKIVMKFILTSWK